MQPAEAEVVQKTMLPGLDRDHGRVPVGQDVVARMTALGARVAEVVAVGDGPDHREDQPRRDTVAARDRCGGHGCGEHPGGGESEQENSGCRPVRWHGERSTGAKGQRLANAPAADQPRAARRRG